MRRMMLGLAVGLGLATAGGARGAPAAQLTVQADRPGAAVSPLLYGIFFEEINRAGDGGIYAELIQNRSFEDPQLERAWALVKSGDAEGAMAPDTVRPLNDHNPTSLRLETKRGRVGVANGGFKPAPRAPDELAVQAGTAYALSLYARGDGPLTVTLEQADGTVLARADIAGLDAVWKNFAAELTPTATAANARLVIAAARPGTVWLDMVSLCPKGQLFRADLLQQLKAMQPAFVRFPGGCYVEGNQLSEAFRWKQTLGDPAARPGHWNLWGYRSTDGLGFHEYLLLCEALGAAPLYVINCGMSHAEQNGKPPPAGAALDAFVQDALDAIEYANGPVTSKWGAVRAAAGHPAPFNLRMMEIGNENGGPVYQRHFALFHDAIKARYPDFQLVSDQWGGLPGNRRIDIADEHYYDRPEFFMRQAIRYDKYDRAAHRVYVGEYAVTQGAGRGNLRAALGEAAFMTGLERNGDVVAMASYAPLFERAGWRHWNPNAIQFDAARCYGTPSWHVQTLFSRNRADVVLPVAVTAAAAAESRRGFVGVGTWQTQAEFKDLRVTQGDRVLFAGTNGWRLARGDWRWEGDVLRQTGGAENLCAFAGGRDWHDYTLTLKARKLGGAEGFLITFAAPNEQEKSWWNLGGWGNTSHAIEMRDVEAQHVPGRIATGRWYDIKIELSGHRIRCTLDGQLIHDTTAGSPPACYAVAGRDRARGEIVLKTVNTAAAPLAAQVTLAGARQVAATAEAIVLTSASGDDENSFEHPARVAPRTETLRDISASFPHTFPANSVTVLRVKAD